MASIGDTIATRLRGDATFMALAQGLVWTRPLKRQNEGATPQAFGTAKQIKSVAVVVRERPQEPHTQERAIYGAYVSMPQIFLYAPAVDTGKAAIRAARTRIRDLMNGWTFRTDEGPMAFVRYIDNFGINDSEEFIGSVYDYCRIEVTSRYANEV